MAACSPGDVAPDGKLKQIDGAPGCMHPRAAGQAAAKHVADFMHHVGNGNPDEDAPIIFRNLGKDPNDTGCMRKEMMRENIDAQAAVPMKEGQIRKVAPKFNETRSSSCKHRVLPQHQRGVRWPPPPRGHPG